MKKQISRREFVQSSAVVAAALSLPGLTGCGGNVTAMDPKDMPTISFGNTGQKVPRMGFGCGSRWMSIEEDDKALEILQSALDKGVYYWDTASSYGNDRISSEERISQILSGQREKVFLTSKTGERDADKAKESIERSLKRLQTDYLDLLHVHSIKSVEDAEELGEKGKVYEILARYREEGVIRHIGFTGHTSAAGMMRAAELYDFDAMMMALNHHSSQRTQAYEEDAAPFARKKGMGVVAMKVIRPRESVEGLTAGDLIDYALSLKDFHILNIGIDSMEVLESNIARIKAFKAPDEERMQEIRLALQPFYQGRKLSWLQPGYRDGMSGPVSLA